MTTQPLSGRTILVCVCGGIAAYKICDVVSKLAQSGATVDVAMTPEATQFVGPLTFQALTNRPVHTSMWATDAATTPIPHINLAQSADLILLAPATGNTLARFAAGIADDLVTNLLLASNPKRLLIAPAMNEGMWNHPATQRNLKTVFDFGVTFIGPGQGWQACRTIGVGRMSESAEILAAIESKLATLTAVHQSGHFVP